MLLKIVCYGAKSWYHKDLANDLFLSNAEISNSLERNAASGLLDAEKKRVNLHSLFEFLVYGIKFVFPQRPANIMRGIPTAHSHPFMKSFFSSDQTFVWPDADGDDKGLSILPLYPGAVNAGRKDEKLYLMLALIDVLRVGKAREKGVAMTKLKELFDV